MIGQARASPNPNPEPKPTQGAGGTIPLGGGGVGWRRYTMYLYVHVKTYIHYSGAFVDKDPDCIMYNCRPWDARREQIQILCRKTLSNPSALNPKTLNPNQPCNTTPDLLVHLVARSFPLTWTTRPNSTSKAKKLCSGSTAGSRFPCQRTVRALERGQGSTSQSQNSPRLLHGATIR